jgi:hypothetical protein
MLFPSETGSTQTPLELITKASNIIAVIQCGGFWFANGKFGVTWKLIQCVVRPKPTLKGRCLISVSSENKTQLEKAAPASASSSVQLGQDEDDEDDASEEVGTGQLKVVEDSDEEGESTASDPQVSVAPVVEEAVAAPATPATPAVVKKEVKRIVKKKE